MCIGAVSGPIQYNWIFVLRSDTVYIGAVLSPIQCVSDLYRIVYSVYRSSILSETICFGPVSHRIRCTGHVQHPIPGVSELFKIPDSLYWICIGSYTICFGSVYGPIEYVSDMHRIPYSARRSCIGRRTVCIGDV